MAGFEVFTEDWPEAFKKLGARDQIRTGDPHVGKEMLALISLRIFA